MKLASFTRIAALAVMFAFQVSNASLIVRDLDSPGDGLLTFDDQTGLEWLDNPPTLGLSPAEIIAGAGGYVARGFRYATDEEVITLALDAGVSPLYDVQHSRNFMGILFLQYLYLGISWSDNSGLTVTEGYAGLNERTPGTVDSLAFLLDNTGSQSGVLQLMYINLPLDSADFRRGSFLVRDVSEPATLALLGLGLAGLGLSHRKQ